jgi:hypothetical protein
VLDSSALPASPRPCATPAPPRALPPPRPARNPRPAPRAPKVPWRGFHVAIEFDGPSHFTAAPPSPGNAGGLFAAAPRRQQGEDRLRGLLIRANPGWLVAPLPHFDW